MSISLINNYEPIYSMPSSIHLNVILDLNCVSSLIYFKHTDVDEVNILLSILNKTTCMFDPFPAGLFPFIC